MAVLILVMASLLDGWISGLDFDHAFAHDEVVLEPNPEQVLILMDINGSDELLLGMLVLVAAEDGELAIGVLGDTWVADGV